MCCLPCFYLSSLPHEVISVLFCLSTLVFISGIFHHGASLEPFPHPGLLTCGIINPEDEAFPCCCSQIHFFVVLALSVLPFLLISSETLRAEDSKEAQKEGRSTSEVIAQ